MSQIISASINLSKIDKTKITEKNGVKYLNIQISINDEKDQFGNDCSISINQSKEEREDKQPKTYLGNGKIVWSSEPKPQTTSEPQPKYGGAPEDDLPF